MKGRKGLNTKGFYKNILCTPQIGDRVRIKKGHIWSTSSSITLRNPILCLRWYIRAGCYGVIVPTGFRPIYFSVKLDYSYSSFLGPYLPCIKEEVVIVG
jgi:hypothetical protein